MSETIIYANQLGMIGGDNVLKAVMTGNPSLLVSTLEQRGIKAEGTVSILSAMSYDREHSKTGISHFADIQHDIVNAVLEGDISNKDIENFSMYIIENPAYLRENTEYLNLGKHRDLERIEQYMVTNEKQNEAARAM